MIKLMSEMVQIALSTYHNNFHKREGSSIFKIVSTYIYIYVYNLIMHYSLFDQHKFIRTFRISY